MLSNEEVLSSNKADSADFFGAPKKLLRDGIRVTSWVNGVPEAFLNPRGYGGLSSMEHVEGGKAGG